MSNEFFIGRQPILDKSGQIYAYELLFRQAGSTQAQVVDNSAATARVLINAIQNIGLRELLGGKKGFINADESIIMDGALDILPKEDLVIEILETTIVTDALIEKVAHYKSLGFIFALDDMVFTKEYYAMFSKLLKLVDIIKVDYMECDKNSIPKHMELFKKLNCKVLAEKVETRDDYELCRELGFDLFQGYFFAKPVVISQKSVDPSKTATVQLINMIQHNAEAAELEKVIKNYPDLYINMLKFMNSAAFGTKGTITSIKHAMALLGRENLSKWLYLILYAGPYGDSLDNPLLITAQMRGRMMESITNKSKISNELADEAYLVGLLSLMDVVFNKELKDVIQDFNIDDEIKHAVIFKNGELGRLLKTVQDYEKDNVEELNVHFDQIGLDFSTFNTIMQDSFNYAHSFCELKKE